jgi:hypothetical protein
MIDAIDDIDGNSSFATECVAAYRPAQQQAPEVIQ